MIPSSVFVSSPECSKIRKYSSANCLSVGVFYWYVVVGAPRAVVPLVKIFGWPKAIESARKPRSSRGLRGTTH